MAKEPKPFTITLTDDGAASLVEPNSEGGHQKLHGYLRDQLANNNRTITLNDGQLGRIVRYMIQDGASGFPARLRKAFREPLNRLLTE